MLNYITYRQASHNWTRFFFALKISVMTFRFWPPAVTWYIWTCKLHWQWRRLFFFWEKLLCVIRLVVTNVHAATSCFSYLCSGKGERKPKCTLDKFRSISMLSLRFPLVVILASSAQLTSFKIDFLRYVERRYEYVPLPLIIDIATTLPKFQRVFYLYSLQYF